MRTLLIAGLTAYLAIAAEKAPEPKPEAPAKVHITLGDLSKARPALDKLFGLELPVKVAWSLRKTVAAIEGELKRFEEQRLALVKKYGKQENGTLQVPPERMQAFLDDFKVLSEITVDLSVERISLSLFGEGVKLSPSDMARLDPFLIP